MTLEEEILQAKQALAQSQQIPTTLPTLARGSPEDGTRPGWLGLLGESLGGGQGAGYQLRGQEEDAAGSRALLNFGIQTLLASGPSSRRPDVLGSVAHGLQGAQQSVAGDQRRGQARAESEYSGQLDRAKLAQMQSRGEIERLKALIPLLQLQRDESAMQRLRGGGGAGVSGGGGADTYEGAVIGSEGTGKNPRSSATGTGQFLDSTWKDFATENPQLFAGKTPEQIMASRSDPALGQAAVTWLAQRNATQLKAQGVEPSGTSLRVAHWVGAGPAAKIMQAPEDAPIAGFVSPEAVKANPELATMTAGQMRQRFANVPNPAFLTPSQGGRRQEASRDTGTRTDATTKPPEPEQQPQQPPVPGTEPFVFRMPNLPANEMEAFNPRLSPEAAALHQRNIEGANTPAAIIAAQQALATAQEAKRNSAAAAVNAERVRQETAWRDSQKEARTRQDKIDEEGRAHQRAIDLAERGAALTRTTNAESADVARQEKRMEQIDTAAGAARESVGSLDMMRALSTTVGKVDPWTQLPILGARIQEWMVRLGVGSPEQIAQMGNQQAYEAAANKIVLALKQGVSMGNTSDRDLDFLRAQIPGLLSRPETRGNIIGFLEMAYQRKIDFAQTVSKYYRPGKVSVAEAEAKADAELGPLLKPMPTYGDLQGEDQRKARDLWIYNNITPGTFYKNAAGKLTPYNPPPGWKPEGAE